MVTRTNMKLHLLNMHRHVYVNIALTCNRIIVLAVIQFKLCFSKFYKLTHFKDFNMTILLLLCS